MSLINNYLAYYQLANQNESYIEELIEMQLDVVVEEIESLEQASQTYFNQVLKDLNKRYEQEVYYHPSVASHYLNSLIHLQIWINNNQLEIKFTLNDLKRLIERVESVFENLNYNDQEYRDNIYDQIESNIDTDQLYDDYIKGLELIYHTLSFYELEALDDYELVRLYLTLMNIYQSLQTITN